MIFSTLSKAIEYAKEQGNVPIFRIASLPEGEVEFWVPLSDTDLDEYRKTVAYCTASLMKTSEFVGVRIFKANSFGAFV